MATWLLTAALMAPVSWAEPELRYGLPASRVIAICLVVVALVAHGVYDFFHHPLPPMKLPSQKTAGLALSFRALVPTLLLSSSLVLPRLSAADSLDEAAIRRIVDAQVAAWNAGDGTAYAEHFAAEGSFTNLFGMVMYGQAAFAKRHADILAGIYKGTEKREIITKIRVVTPDVAIVDVDNEIHGVKAMPAGLAVPADGVLRTKLMQVFVKRDGVWWIEAYHNVDVKPPAT